MARVNEGKLILTDDENALIEEGKEFDLIPNQKGIYLLIEKDLEKGREGTQVCIAVPDKTAEAKEMVIGKIKKANLSDLVEGKFEDSLSVDEKTALKSLLEEKKVFIFKLNETYKKGVYKVSEELETRINLDSSQSQFLSESFDTPEKNPEEYTLEKDGIIIEKNDEKVKQISAKNEKAIKEGKLKGIKSFDGNYYIIHNSLLEKYLAKVVASFEKEGNQNITDLARGVSASKMLVKIVCEFLKDEGEIIERRQGEYAFIS